MKRIMSFLILFIYLILASSSTVFAVQNEIYGAKRNDTYFYYTQKHKDAKKPMQTIQLQSTNFTINDATNISLEQYNGRESALWNGEDKGYIETQFEVNNSGLYNIALSYCSLKSKFRDTNIKILINDELPFREAEELQLTKIIRDLSEIYMDENGNEYQPKQEEVNQWQDLPLLDPTGQNNEPLFFHLNKGKNSVKIYSSRGHVAISGMKIYNSEPIISYDEYTKLHKDYKKPKEFSILLQGENADYKSDSMLSPSNDRDLMTIPSDPVDYKLNTIGGTRWQYPAQWILWNFDVPEDGLYKISFRAKQNLINGVTVHRRMYIDHKVPFSEANAIPFPFDTKWYGNTVKTDSGDQCLIALDKGKHTVKLEVVPGQMGNSVKELMDCVYSLNYWSRRILMIAGTQADTYRDYNLDDQIDGLIEGFTELANRLETIKNNIDGMSGGKAGETYNIEKLVVQLRSFIEDTDTIAVRQDSFRSNISGLSAWIVRLSEQPLELDYIQITDANTPNTPKKANFFQSMWFSIQRFFGSFSGNADKIGKSEDSKEAVTVWVSLGRQQAQSVKQMVDDDFTAKTGIPVNIELVKDGLTQAVLAGRGPDVVLFLASDQPVNMAVRGAAVDLTKLDGYNEVVNRFMPSAMIPYEFEGGYYALPVQQNFNMMFYRKDILEELNLNVPNTWKDLYDILPVIQQNNMTVGIPCNAVDASGAGRANNFMFDSLLYQHGGKHFDEERTKTLFDEPPALEAFKQWTEFYTKYSLPLEYDFYNRFSTGEMPIGIDSYVMYNKILVGAPEISGLWGMAPIPATIKDDGTLDRSVSGTTTAGMIFSNSDNINGSWEFLKWFTSADVQSKYGLDLEVSMGPAGRYDTANVEAFKTLPWGTEESAQLLKQWSEVKDVPVIPASYYVYRNIFNAFRNVAYNYTNPREILHEYNKEMNDEITRKRKEFNMRVIDDESDVGKKR